MVPDMDRAFCWKLDIISKQHSLVYDFMTVSFPYSIFWISSILSCFSWLSGDAEATVLRAQARADAIQKVSAALAQKVCR